MPSAVLEARGLTIARGGETVLSDVSFTVGQGEVFALLGGNGAGKSTTLLAFLGFLKPTAGAALVNAMPAADDPAGVRAVSAYLPEAAALYPHLTARENLQYFSSLGGRKVDDPAIDAALDRVGLQSDARGRRLEGYSKGMRQKTAIALALLREAKVLFLDEPTSGLDPVAIDEFNALVRSLAAEGASVLMVTHDVYGACQVASRIALLRRGMLVGRFEAEGGARIDTAAVHDAFAAGARETGSEAAA